MVEKIIKAIVNSNGLKNHIEISELDIFYFIYAQLHSLTYRKRYKIFLKKTNFPNILLPLNYDLFKSLSIIGAELTSLHLIESPKLNKSITKFIEYHPQQ